MSLGFIHALFISIDYYRYVCTVVNKYTGMLICTLIYYFYRYYDQLCAIENKLPIAENQVTFFIKNNEASI